MLTLAPLMFGGFLALFAVFGAMSVQILVALVRRDWSRAFKHTALSMAGFTFVNVVVFAIGFLVALARSFAPVGGTDASSKATILAAAIAEAMNLGVPVALLGGIVFGGVMAWRVRRPRAA